MAALSAGTPRDIDIGEVNGHLFLCSSVIGFASRLGGQRERWRGKLHPWRWLRLIVRIAQTLYRDPTLEVGFSGTTRPPLRTRYLVWWRSVCTRRRPDSCSPAPAWIPGNSASTRCAGRPSAGWPGSSLAALLGRWRRAPDLIASEAGTLTVTSARQRLRVMNDGEATLLDVPLRYGLRVRALRVLAPPPESTGPAVGAGPSGSPRA